MPEWTSEDERQYDHVKKSLLEDGVREDEAEEIAARTVNKQRRKEGQTPNQTTHGTGNPKTRLEDRTLDELRNLAAERDVAGRSKMNKSELVNSLRR